LLIDPFITGNPVAKSTKEQKAAEFILITHGHGDHLGDAIALAKKSKAMIISNFEICTYCQSQGVENVHPMHIGGGHEFPFGSVKLTIAHHGSTLGDKLQYGGNPVGFIIRTGGKTLYHAGDTGLFMDMQLIGELDDIDLAMLPIGDNFTMNIPDAVKAVEFLKPKKAIPMHYNTFDLIACDPQDFAKGVKQLGTEGIILNFGESYELN
jgi:L-ascorbate metabolism protein UlaG (beta-lactamase superfamily)